MANRKSAEKRELVMVTEGEDEQSWMSHPVVVAVERDLAKGKMAICAECGTEFVRIKGYRHCCSDECQKAQMRVGSAKGAQATKDLWAVERAKTTVGSLDVKDALGV